MGNAKTDDYGDAPELFVRIVREVQALPLKFRLRLLDAVKPDATLEREDGLRFSMESLREYKRAKKQTTADGQLIEWIQTFTPADVFFDIGANTGALSLMTARVHEGRVPVFAFEPAFDTFNALVRNISINDLGHVVTALQVALSDQSGVKPFYRASVGAGTAAHSLGEPIDSARRPFTPAAVEHVLAIRIDDLVEWFGVPPPTRIKLDVDGLEGCVLAGSARTLRTARCEIYVELVETTPGDAHHQAIIEFLDGLGYELIRTVEHRAPGDYPRVFDAFFVPRRGASA